MEIKKELPFKMCETCQKFDLKTKLTKMYSYDEIVAYTAVIVCEHEQVCRYLVKRLKGASRDAV